MESENPFTDYCDAVCARVRWPFARWGITRELTAHLEDHAAVLEACGASPEEAKRLYEYFTERCKAHVGHVEHGEFGADMKVELLNDGPFTLMLDSGELFAKGDKK